MKARHRVEYDDEKDFITIEASRRKPTSINRSLGDLLEEIIADLRSRNQCLTVLSGLLDGPAADVDIDERRATPILSFKISGTAEVWTREIIDSFPKIDVLLAERLGEANWQRYQRVSKKLNGTDYSEDQSGSSSDDSEEDEVRDLLDLTEATKSSADPGSVFSSAGRQTITTGTSVSNNQFEIIFLLGGRGALSRILDPKPPTHRWSVVIQAKEAG